MMTIVRNPNVTPSVQSPAESELIDFVPCSSRGGGMLEFMDWR